MQSAEPKKIKGNLIHLSNMPLDIEEYIIEMQAAEKKECRCSRSKEFTIYTLLREHREMNELKLQKK